MTASTAYDVVVIGGGAAGLFCAAQLGQRGQRVAVLERTAKPGKKILMSGGGRCNFTNMYTEPDNYLSANPHFCKSALSRYTPWDFIGLVSDHGIPYHEKKLGQLFCDHSAKDILNMLLRECERGGVNLITHCEVAELEASGGFRLRTNRGLMTAAAVVIATGGLSIPTMGVTPYGYDVARQFGHRIQPTRAGLVPFVFTDTLKQLCAELSGVAVDTRIATDSAEFRENILFTHRGLSGPAVLQVSSYWEPGTAISIDLLPEAGPPGWLQKQKAKQGKQRLRSILSQHLPKKLVAQLETLWWQPRAETPLGEWPDQALHAVEAQLHRWQLTPAGTEGYRTAEVTLGGVATDDLSSQTMESRLQPGLFFIGEVVDVTGHLGGYNFQWAWASAFAMANGI
ncbi:MAG: NAD(P)/FAD-dependent oxidoreductase [Pseudomonadota bacterium]|nr:NAD(P)/FAD-dependent oxidoreductase [Pseudomonadota bacterium]